MRIPSQKNGQSQKNWNWMKLSEISVSVGTRCPSILRAVVEGDMVGFEAFRTLIVLVYPFTEPIRVSDCIP